MSESEIETLQMYKQTSKLITKRFLQRVTLTENCQNFCQILNFDSGLLSGYTYYIVHWINYITV